MEHTDHPHLCGMRSSVAGVEYLLAGCHKRTRRSGPPSGHSVVRSTLLGLDYPVAAGRNTGAARMGAGREPSSQFHTWVAPLGGGGGGNFYVYSHEMSVAMVR